MTLEEKARSAISRLTPRLQELANGYVELEDADPVNGILTIRLYGGRLH